MSRDSRNGTPATTFRHTPIDRDPGLVRLEDEVGRFDSSYVTLDVALRWAILAAFVGVCASPLVPMHPLALAGAAGWLAITNVVSTLVWLQKRRVAWYDNTYLFADILAVSFAVLAAANLGYPFWAAFLMVMATAAAELSNRLAILNIIGCTAAYLACAGIIALAGWSDPNVGTLVVTSIVMTFIGINLIMTFDGSRRLRSYIRRISVTDPLTGLANRRRLTHALTTPPDTSRALAVIVLDVDDFKRYNDSLGHLAGDQLLVRLADALNHEFPDAHIISRYGGDEFVLLVPSDNVEHTSKRAARITEGGPYEAIPVSVGIALWPHHEPTLDATLAAADECLRTAKTTNKGGVVALPHNRTPITTP